MNYDQTIRYLYESLPMFTRTGAKAIKLDLEKTQQLCAWLGNPETKFKTIHVAGTNGKGSVSSMLSAIFQHHGFKTGLYTSPHLRDFRERIRINGKMISKKFVVDFVRKSKEFSGEIHPSFFELTFAMAMDYFAAQKVDIAIIETGLGGRLDSTNVITPELSVITNIGWDHMDILGDTLQKIAAEKAGIIKENIPVVIGESQTETVDVFIRKANEKNAPISFADQNFMMLDAQVDPKHSEIAVKELSTGDVQIFQPDLTGMYQQKNLLTVLQSVKVLEKEFDLKPAMIKKALSHVKKLSGLEGRWQILDHDPLIVMDVAHNADGIRQIIAQLATLRYKELHMVTGMVKDKDVSAVLELLPTSAVYYFTNAHIPRALPAKELLEKAGVFGLKGRAFDDVNAAVLSAINDASANDLIIICGSVFVVGEVDVKKLHINVPTARPAPGKI